jgi:hypothetical protein
MSTSIFSMRPKAGDVWEFKLPNKSKKRKTINRVTLSWCASKGRQYRAMVVWWERLPKGRYTGLRVKKLIKHGQLIRRSQPRSEGI